MWEDWVKETHVACTWLQDFMFCEESIIHFRHRKQTLVH